MITPKNAFAVLESRLAMAQWSQPTAPIGGASVERERSGAVVTATARGDAPAAGL